MIRSLILLLGLVNLMSCVNYADIKSHSSTYNAISLSKPHHYTVTPQITSHKQREWWARFNDAQLEQFIEIGLQDSPTIQIAKERLARAQYLADSSRSSLFPSINADALVAREHYTANGIIPPPFGGQSVSYGDIALNFKYELDFWGKNREALAAYTSEAQVNAADLAAAKLIISTSVATSYFKLRSNLALLNNAKAIFYQRQTLLTIIRTRDKHHLESYIPINQASSDVQAAQQTLVRIEQAILLNRHQLAILVGNNPFTTQITVQPFIYHKQTLQLPYNIPANLIGRRPDIIASRWQVESNAHLVNVAKTRFFPNLNLSAFLSYQSIGLGKLFQSNSRDNNIQGAIDLPIFDAGLRRADLKARYAEYDIAVNQYNQAILNALQEVADQMATLHAIKQEQALNLRTLRNLQHNYTLTQSRYKHGIADYSQVLEMKGPLLTQQKIEIQLQTQHILAIIAMIKALGGDYLATQG